MQKTKLGISVGLLGAAIYFAGLFGGYVAVLLLAGYVLLIEENAWLKRSAVKAVVLMMGFSMITILVNLIPNVLNVLQNILYIFNVNFNLLIIDKIATAIRSGVNLIEQLLLLGLGYKALGQGTIVISAVDRLISKYMD